MKKRKGSNGCLLSFMKTIVVSMFALLISFFGFYLLSQNPQRIYEDTIQETGKSIDLDYPLQNEIEQEEIIAEEYKIPEEEVAHSEENSEENSEVSSSISLTDSEEEVADLPSIAPEDKEKEKVSVPVYSKYELSLTDYIIEEVGDVIHTEHIDITKLVGQYFSKMTVKEKMHLVGMLLNKMKTIDIKYVWGILEDGITIDEVEVLQNLIEENFTEQEIDTLFAYYQKSELAQLE